MNITAMIYAWIEASKMLEMLTYPFMQKAFITGIFAAIACALLGTFLVLRRYALIGDGIAHISFGGVATGLLFGITPFFGALIFALIGSLGILKLKDKAIVHGDSAIGIISHASLGIGIFIASIAQGFNVDILSYLFGSILAIKTTEMLLSVFLAMIVIGMILLFYNDLFYITFNEESASTSGIQVNFLNTMLIMMTAITIVTSMRVVGLMLVSALIILPAVSALQFKASFRKTLFLSALISVISVVSGLLTAYYYDFAVSGTIILVNALIFLLLLVCNRMKLFSSLRRLGAHFRF
jgi:zinc transport system permease protein